MIKTTKSNMYSIKATPFKAHYFSLINNVVNSLNQAPLKNTPYIVNNKKYGRPDFRCKRRGGDGFPESDAFWFTKDEETGKVTLHCIIEVFREEPDVHPLSIKNTKIDLQFPSGGKTVNKPLKIIQSPFINKVNVLQDLHAEVEIKQEEIKELIDALTDLNKPATLVIKSELWWQKIAPSGPKPKPKLNPRTMKMIATPFATPTFHAAKFTNLTVSNHRKAATVVRDHRKPTRIRHEVVNKVPPISPAQSNKPQKIDLNHTIVLHYDKEDSAVFGDLISRFEVKEFKWREETPVNVDVNDEIHTIYYRPTARPDTFFFLPQVFRIKVNGYTGEPKISVAMVSGDDPNIIEGYRIRIDMQLIPYFNPKAKKDLYKTLNSVSNGEIKYCTLSLSGYNSAAFRLRDQYAGDTNVLLTGKIPEKIDQIDPVNGFTLMVDCTFESFDYFKRKLKDGFFIGDIVFELIEETEGGEKVKSQRIPVELDIRKLAGIPVDIEVINSENEDNGVPKGVKIFNTNSFPITVKGTELTLLSEINDIVYDADYEIGNLRNDWPLTIQGEKQQEFEVLLKEEEVDTLSGEGRFWTQLVCEPYGIRIDNDPDAIIGKIIDYATGDPQIWELQISSSLLERWDELDESMLAPYKHLDKIEIEIKREDGNISGVVLSRNKPVDTIQMSRSISQILKSQQLTERKYQYRMRTHYILNKTAWTEWLDPESTASNFLSVIPQLREVN